MKLAPIIQQIQAYCPSIKLSAGAVSVNLKGNFSSASLPAAFVVRLDETAEVPSDAGNSYQQEITENFGVLLVLDNRGVDSARGQTAADTLDTIRNELFAALVDWCPDDEHDEIRFDRGYLLSMDDDLLFYVYEFATFTTITKADTWNDKRYREILGPFETVDMDVDLSPPDGRIEAEVEIDLTKPTGA